MELLTPISSIKIWC